LVRYAIAAATVLAAMATRMIVALTTDSPTNFPTFYVAVLTAAMLGGVGPGVATLAISTVIVWTLWLGPPVGGVLHAKEGVPIAMFLICGGLMVLFMDILRRAVRTGLAAEERFRVAQEASLDAFVLLEPVREGGKVVDFRWTYANPAAEAMRPAGASTLVGRRVREAFNDQTGHAMADRLKGLFESGGPDDIDVHRVINGQDRWIRSSGVKLGHDLAVTFRDVTESVEARRDLEARVIERTAALEASIAEKAKAEAALAQAQRLETVGRLTGGVAHDFNNLLTVIVGGLDMILRHPSDEARVRRLAEAALSAGQRGERLTRQLLAFSRNQELKLETIDIPVLVTQVESLLARAVGEAMTLTVLCDPHAGASKVDAAQFEAALLNLVVNAVDATPDDGQITVEVTSARLDEGEVADTSAGDYVRVAVTDTGTGMPPEVLTRVFEPFFTTKEVGKGTGLGLAQVYGFLRQSGGGVSIDSVEGRGSTVTLYLPATVVDVSAAVVAEPVAPVVAPADLTGTRVLLVEDDAAVRAIAEGVLLDLGCSVVTALDGVNALAILEREAPFDLLMSDIIMPGGVSGVDLAHVAAARDPSMAILLTTGYAGEKLAMAPADLPWPLLRKPFRVEQLSEAVAAVLERRPADA
jgi:signal transduction histidine kinase